MVDPSLEDFVRSQGATAADMQGLDDGELIGLAGDLAASSGQTLNLGQLAEAGGTDVDTVRRLYNAVGLDVDSLAGFGRSDVALLQLFTSDPSGIVERAADELLRVAGVSLRRLAEATVAVYVQDIENEPGLDRDDLIHLAEMNTLASGLLVDFAESVGMLFRHHMWVAVHQQRTGQREVVEPQLMRAGIGFVDLVGYTPISGRLGPAELAAYIDSFERKAFDIAHSHGGRVVKSIGDEVMFTAPELGATALIALELVQSFGADHGTAPRGAISAGDVMFRMGDFYGPVVNVAARLVDAAEPGQVLTDIEPGESGVIAGRPAMTRSLKGFDEAVEVFDVASVGELGD
ncbi:MAG: adenylate/guanylate cyclase domain-containing protein [Microthrixaceae bacterium]